MTALTHDADDLIAPDPGDGLERLLRTGSTVGGKYVIQHVLGSGGNGTVYQAEHTAIGHRVAIKVVHPSLSGTAEVLARFDREARICGSLRHPNIGQVYDVGVLECGAPYMVMELQEGRSLVDILAEMTLSIGAIVELARQLLAGLSAAHDSGVIHRDVKPGNVMVVRDANGGVVVKLVDFGICKRLQPAAEGNVTQRGMMVGSPDYMAPEQLRGEEVDPRTDVYAVGALLYEAITGRPPFDGQTMADLLVAILQAPLAPPNRYRPECPPELQLLVLAALSRERGRRPPCAEQMGDGLALVPLPEAECDPGATLTDLSERLQPRAGGMIIRRPRTVRTIKSGERAGNALRKPQPGLVRAGISAMLALVLLPALIAAGDATRHDATVASRRPLRTAVVVAAAPAERQPESNAAPASSATQPIGAERALSPSTDVPQTASGRPRFSASPAASRTAPNATVESEKAVQALVKAAATAFVHGDVARARELYLQALARDRQHPDALRGLGVALSRMSRHAEAARAFERYLVQRPNAADAARIAELLDKLQGRGALTGSLTRQPVRPTPSPSERGES